MKALLLLLPLLDIASPPKPPAVRVTFSSLTKAAYEQAGKTVIETKPRVTFPLHKQRGRLIIPTAKGQKVFTDIVIDDAAIKRGHSEDEMTIHTYRGFLPDFHCHLIEVQLYEISQWLLISDAGQQVVLWGKPLFSPDGKHIIATCMGIEYGGGQPNSLELLARQSGAWRTVWHLEPTAWEPYQVGWISPATLLLSKEMWTGKNPGTTFTYARLTIQ